MHRTHTCGELRIENQGQKVTLAGWVQNVRDIATAYFIVLRDRYGLTQVTVLKSDETNAKIAAGLGREWVIKVAGTVNEREAKNNT